ncbi:MULTISPECIES: TetR/AcrR family transcriptional regulator [unclassified Oceanispirochaeta]|uniref:TetR/AcrR family transcriptional regulator n=1 Tax=unclassified Oceanispirochaeta TaxID=2635722 RepID=UPI000E0914FF|nr:MULTISPECIES: TetR/AcrR family transcriptional regulator [unclassified Oceanispirochaeta]MBF9018147.1 TetR/AcrR family transcriptional regulator [Oceanispirochaeta sp. M2]NPD74611.1 TetR/AcrR family transcriptional regulator [Oceanispirochaeta sp. M1]RDG29562.1 TetR/AcrR family transcriptional regulator [Oceanispirochaeta sp. M1]
MAKDTDLKIRKAALELFSTSWFETVSIAEVCRHAGVSNGVFYRYYSKKDNLVRVLLEEFLSRFKSELEDIQGNTKEEQLLDFITTLNNVGINHKQYVSVFREGQYRFPEYEERLRTIYIEVISTIFGREVREAEYLYIISGIRFCSTRALYDGLPREPEKIRDLILNGVFRDEKEGLIPDIPDSFFSYSEDSAEDSRSRLLSSGIKLIGDKGYHAIGVGDIARETGLAVGTFYTYFNKKEEFFSELIRLIGHRIRLFLSEQTLPYKSRFEKEVFGIYFFLSYMSRHTEYYAIIREAEFVSKPWVSEYYNSFEQGYMKNLSIEDEKDRRITANFLIGLSHYVGIEGLLNDRVSDSSALLKTISQYLIKGVSL